MKLPKLFSLPANSRWVGPAILGVGFLVGIVLCLVVVTSFDRLNQKPLPPQNAIPTSSEDVPTAEDFSDDENASSTNVLDESSVKALEAAREEAEPWMKTAELFESADGSRSAVKYLLIQGDDSKGWNTRNVVKLVDPEGRSRSLLDEEYGGCSHVTATATREYFLMSEILSPCEAYAEYHDSYFSWDGKSIVSVDSRTDAAEFSFQTEHDTIRVALALDYHCTQGELGYDEVWDEHDNMKLKTRITGVTVGGVLRQLSTPMEVECGEAYGAKVVDPFIGSPMLQDGRLIFGLLGQDYSSDISVSVSVSNPNDVVFSVKR